MRNGVLSVAPYLQFPKDTAKRCSWVANLVGPFHVITCILHIHGLLVYTVLTEVPAVFVLYDSSFWSGVYLILIFSVSVWNGGGFYIEVFGRK